MDDITNKDTLKHIKNKLKKINIDGIIDSSSIGNLIENENNSIYPTFFQTERPDVATINLLRGKIVILMDTSPNAIILPSFFLMLVLYIVLTLPLLLVPLALKPLKSCSPIKYFIASFIFVSSNFSAKLYCRFL